MKIRTEPVVRRGDHRGDLIKAWPQAVSGEVYAVELHPGLSRGHHLHLHGGEWFVVLSGRALLVVEDPATGARAEVPLDGIRARVEPGQAHALFAIGGPALVLALADLAHPAEGTEPWPIAPPPGLA